MGGTRTWRLALALTAPLVFASLARAQTPSATALRWQAPPECPQAASFAAQVEHLLGQTLDARRDQSLHVVGEVVTSAVGFTVQLHVTSALGTQRRELTHRDCAELSEAAALVTALAIDPHLVVPEARSEPAPEPEPAAAATPVPTEPPSKPDSKPAQEPAPLAPRVSADRDRDTRPTQPSANLRASIAALGLVGSSVLPGVGLGVGGLAALGRGPLQLAVAGTYWLPRFRALEAGAGPGIELGAWGVGLKACWLPLSGDITVTTCLGPTAGDMYGSGNEQLSDPTTEHDRWSALEAELGLAISAKSGLTTLLGLQLGKTVEAPRFGIREDGRDVPVFEANGWSFNGFVGLGQFR